MHFPAKGPPDSLLSIPHSEQAESSFWQKSLAKWNGIIVSLHSELPQGVAVAGRACKAAKVQWILCAAPRRHHRHLLLLLLSVGCLFIAAPPAIRMTAVWQLLWEGGARGGEPGWRGSPESVAVPDGESIAERIRPPACGPQSC